jgi:hypothetical protein
MMDAFLRLQPHEETVVDFTGVAADDLAIAIVAGLNWLNHCSVLAGVDYHRYSGTLRSFRKIASIAQQWWAMEGAQARCIQMLQAREKPPLMLHLIWQDYTRLAKEIASAAIFGPAIEKTIARRRATLEQEFAGHPAELAAAIAELTDTMASFAAAREPDRSRNSASSAERLSAEETIRTRLPMTSIKRLNSSGAAACAIRAGAPMMPRR